MKAMFTSRKGGVIRWTFENIQLPDSLSDEPNSHGFVMFRILPKLQLPNGTELRNTAHIIFDFNAAITTNTVLNTVLQAPEASASGQSLVFAPNPMRTSSWIYPLDEAGEAEVIGREIQIFQPDGQLIMKQKLQGASPWKWENPSLPAGLFLVTIKAHDGKLFQGKLVVQ